MNRRCWGTRHRGSWDVVLRESTPGLLANHDLMSAEIRGETGLQLALGVTNIAQRCSNCGWIQITTVTGTVGAV